MNKILNTNLPPFFRDLSKCYPSEQDLIDIIDAENAIIYGIPCYIIEKSIPHGGVFFLSEENSENICFANNDTKGITKLNIKSIRQMSFGTKSENLMNFTPIKGHEYIQIMIGKKSYDFGFLNHYNILLVIKGLLSIFHFKKLKFEENMESQIFQIANKYDANYDEKYDYEEFKGFANEIGVKPSTLILDVDINHDGIVTKDEIIHFLKSKTSGEQFAVLFKKYAVIINNKEVITPVQLKKFFHEIQNEKICDIEAYQLVIHFFNEVKDNNIKRIINKKMQNCYRRNNYRINEEEINKIINKINTRYNINIKLELTLREFTHMLNSLLLTVYDTYKIYHQLNLNYTLTDYYINSTHNTYLTGHQLKGRSSIKMYSLSLLQGCRLVELDCYNGDGDEIIITHGYTLVTELSLEDILHELKQSAFINSPLPVILSIENHLDKYHQEIMAKKLKDILGVLNIYIFPNDKKPEYIPSLEDMKYKFIIKCSGKRLWEKENIGRKIKNRNNQIKWDRKKDDVLFMKKMILINDNYDDVIDSDEENDTNTTVINEDNIFSKKNNNDIFSTNLIRQLDDFEESELPTDKTLLKNKTNFNYENVENIPIIQSLENIRGLLGMKFKYKKIEENNYKPWDFVTIKSKKLIKYYNEPIKRKTMISLSNHCMIKAYPQSFDSSNYDIIKCWSMGVQAAAINIQATKDDYTLFNKIFFSQYNNCGYVLKPRKLLDEISILNDYNYPMFIVEFKLYSVYNLNKLIENKDKKNYSGKLYVEIYSLGYTKDDKFPKKKIKLKGGMVFPVIKRGDEVVNIPVYEGDLGGLMFKIYKEEKMIGRGCIPYCLMKEGYRRIPLFDNDCFLCEGAYAVGYFKKTRYFK